MKSRDYDAVVKEIFDNGRNSPDSVYELLPAVNNATNKHRLSKLASFKQLVNLSNILKPENPVTNFFAPDQRLS